MVFSNLFFLYFFLPICLLCYFITKKIEIRNLVLIVFSLIFYAWGEPVWVILLVFVAAFDYFHGLLIEKYKGRAGAKLALISSIVLNLGILGLFKYSAFFVSNLNGLLGVEIPVPQLSLPIGISFYTFRKISYTVDCYWGKVEAQRSFAKFLMYVSLFPQLMAGPIVRYRTIATELSDRKTTLQDLYVGLGRLVIGLAKKVLIADNLGSIVHAFFGSGNISGLSVLGTWYGALIFMLQIYFDFSGYSDMAIGLGRIFGFHFEENFDFPFICKNITEFWQRWHMSLTSFFRDYVLYIPLFGKRRQYASLFLVWFCTGLWHGANWNYILWGLYFGVLIALERLLTLKRLNRMPGIVMQVYNKIVLIIGFGIFYFEDMGRLGDFFKNLVGANGNAFLDTQLVNSFVNHIFLIMLACVFCFPILRVIKDRIRYHGKMAIAYNAVTVACNVALLLVCSIMLVNATNNPFLYFRW